MNHTAPQDWIVNGPEDAQLRVAFAHGAGLPMDSPFMNVISDALAAHELRVIRFEFPYMAQRRLTDRKKPPNTLSILRQTWLEVIEHLGSDKLIISGKSMGGRIASIVADEAEVAGLVCLGYPFHPPGRPQNLRVEHLKQLVTPTLILQGERDPFGRPEEVASYDLAESIEVEWIPDGDHGFKPRKSSGLTEEQNLALASSRFVKFVKALA